MQFLSLNHTVNFMKLRLATMVLSTVLILGSLVSLGMNSLNWGLDFTGGTLIEVGYEESADLEKIRAELSQYYPPVPDRRLGRARPAGAHRQRLR